MAATVDISKIQYHTTGSQIRDAFTAINEALGTEIVDVNSIQNPAIRYSKRVATGRQLKTAFENINAALGTVIDVENIQNWGNGAQLKEAFTLINEAIEFLPQGGGNSEFSSAFSTAFN